MLEVNVRANDRTAAPSEAILCAFVMEASTSETSEPDEYELSGIMLVQ